MMIALRLFQVELTKLRGSLVLLMVAAPPAMMVLMVPAVLASGNGPGTWAQMAMSGSAIWAYLLMPLTVTALTALYASIEHQNGGWTWTLTLPASKVLVFGTKALVCALLLALTTVGIGVAILAGGLVAGLIAPEEALTGALPVGLLFGILARMFLAGLLVLALQFSLAHASASFAMPIIVGIAGTFGAVVATSAQAGIYFPWLLAVNVLASTEDRTLQAILTGLIGGLIVFAGTCVWLAKRDWR